MIMIAIASGLTGAVLGTRFRIQVLCPAMLFGFAVVAAVAASKGLAVTTAILGIALCAVSLQMGFLAGLFTRFCLAAARSTSVSALRSAHQTD
jgi:hypothetical protein